MQLVRIVFMLFALIGFILLITCTAGIAWGRDESQTNYNETITVYIGLWRFCRADNCVSYDEQTVEGWWYAIRIEMILAVMISFIGFILAIAMVARESIKGYYLAGILTPAALLALIGLCTWMSKINNPFKVSYSCVIGFVGVIILVAAIIAVIINSIRRKKADDSAVLIS